MTSVLRIAGIVLVFIVTTIGWFALGGVMTHRTSTQTGRLQSSVAELWGTPQRQAAPGLFFQWKTIEEEVSQETVDNTVKQVRKKVEKWHSSEMAPASTRINADLRLDQRLKGLVWYSLYDVNFGGDWTYQHKSEEGIIRIEFTFPDAQGLYDRFEFIVNGAQRGADLKPDNGRVFVTVPVKYGDTVSFHIGYVSRGMGEWSYVPTHGVSTLSNFELHLKTDFADIDFPGTSMSPSSKAHIDNGWGLEWKFDRVVTGRPIGMVMPTKLQPGELASELSFFAPISLLFFFVLMFVLTTLRKIELHPINYLLLAGAFFAFHLLFGYSVDHLNIVASFALSSVVSIVLVVSYLRLVVGPRFAFVEAALGQLVYLVGFSLAFFWEGYTGLTITVLAILTLFLVMQLTARVRWSEVIGRKPATA